VADQLLTTFKGDHTGWLEPAHARPYRRSALPSPGRANHQDPVTPLTGLAASLVASLVVARLPAGNFSNGLGRRAFHHPAHTRIVNDRSST
jgi:hypothetical protein